MNVIDIAYEIWSEMGEPSSVTPNTIAFWLRSNVGQLNSAINTAYYLNTSKEIEQLDPSDSTQTIPIGIEEAAVFKKIYEVHYFDLKIQENILSYTSGPVIEAMADGHRIRMASPTEIGKNLSNFRKTKTTELKDVINAYKIDKAKARQVVGDDTVQEGEQPWQAS